MVSGDSGKETIRAVTFPHFPTIQQAIVWRNWEMVPVDRLAKVLETTEENILELAAGLGLDVPPNVNKYWLERGYITLIRQNWHLLTYEQILTLLDWTDEKLQFTLKEDDFLYHKLGMFKPYVEKAIYRPLTEEENARTEELREILKKHFPGNQHINSNTAKPFDFLKKFTTTAYSHSTNILDIPLSDMPRLYKFAERFLRKVASKWGMILEIADMENILEKVKKNESVYNMTISLAKANKDKRQENLYINLEVKPDKTMPAESHKIEIEDKVINITSVDEEGILRGLQWLEKQIDVKDNSFILKNYPTKEIQCRIGNYYHQEKDEENIYNDNKHSKFSCPNAAYETNKLSVPMEEQKRSKKTITRKTRFEIRYVYSYFAVYGDPLLDPNIDPYPEGLLESLSEMGVNGVWLQAVLYTLVPWDKAPELSKGWKKRIEGLKSIVKRAADYGIGVYLYFNEPRAMPEEFFVKHPEWKGAGHYDGLYSLCTSHKDIQEYLRNGTARLFTEVPDLAGIFTITMSENHTNCYSHNPPGKKPDCPRCSKRSQAEVIAEVNNIIAEGVHSVKPDARVIAWTWGWHPEWSDEAISLLNKDVILMCTAEEAIPTNIGGIKGQVVDYTMSIPGPGQRAINNWKKAAELGHKTMAKVQFNVTWECSAVPFLPVMNLLYQYLKGLDNSGVSGMQLSWTLGGYPSLNLEFASQLYWDDDNSILPGLYEFAVQKYGIKAAPYIIKAWNTFSDAFKEFPFHVGTLYVAPQNYGPMNLLHEKPTGYRATMIGFPYDDLNSWRSIYPEDIFEEQFRKLSEKWKEGLRYVEQAYEAAREDDTADSISELQLVSNAAYCHFRSTYLQVKFIRLRNRIPEQTQQNDCQEKANTSKLSVDKDIIKNIISVIDEEIELAKLLYDIIKKDSRIGYEASNHYYYTDRDLKEKVINCEYLKKKYKEILETSC